MAALVFDCDGVLADTERYGHLPAFNQMFRELGVPVQWSEDDYADLLLIGGGKERMRSVLTAEFVEANGLPTDDAGQAELVAGWHRRKTDVYTELVDAGVMPPRPGVKRLAEEALAAGWQLAVASTSAEKSVRSVLVHAVGPELAEHFSVFAGDVVDRKKPAPDIYLLAIDRLGVDAADTVAVEDSANGMKAALGAGLACIVTVSSYTADEDFTGAALVVSSLGDPDGEQARVLADPQNVAPQSYVRLQDLETVLARHRSASTTAEGSRA